MDWRFNTIWFEQLEQDKIFQKDFKENTIASENKSFQNAEYAIIWHLQEKLRSFDNLPASDGLLYLELNWANIKNFDGIEQFKHLKRLELHYCVKLEKDKGLGVLNENLEYLQINQSKKFRFSDELLKLKKLKVLCLNACGALDNLDFLKHLPDLIDFRFVNTTVLDGNLRPILDHPALRTVGFLNKRHYNYKDEAIKLEIDHKFKKKYKTMAYKGQYLTFRYDYE